MASWPTLKQPVYASQGVVASNHAIASMAGASMLASGGNVVDAAVATAFALTVVTPSSIGPLGAGYMIHREAGGDMTVIDNYSKAPSRAKSDMYEIDEAKGPTEVKGNKNMIGHLAAGVPGNIKGWWHLHSTKGKLPIDRVMAPAIFYAENGYPASALGVAAIRSAENDFAKSPDASKVFLPGGKPPEEGDTIVNKDLAESLRLILREGPDAVYRGRIGEAIVAEMERGGGLISKQDLEDYEIRMREPIRGSYRGYEMLGTPPSSGGGILNQLGMNILEEFDLHSMGFATARYWHVIIETLKIMYADRNKYLGDPEQIKFPQEQLISKEYGRSRAKEIRLDRPGTYEAGSFPDWRESNNTTHFTVMAADGSTVTATQTLNGGFGCRVMVPGTGLILNNTMALFDPRPNTPNSPAPNKRMLTATAATIVLRDGKPSFALGTPGGIRIFPSVLQAILNVIDHGMNLQEAVEAPRVWANGRVVEAEEGVPEAVKAELEAMGHKINSSPQIAGGMTGVQVDAPTGLLLGAACWRADGAPAGYSGGPAKRVERAPVF